MNGNNRKPVVQIASEFVFFHGRRQITIGCRYNPDIYRNTPVFPDRSKLTVTHAFAGDRLQDPQQFRLQQGRSLSDFIQEKCSPVRRPERSGRILIRSCKSSFFYVRTALIRSMCPEWKRS